MRNKGLADLAELASQSYESRRELKVPKDDFRTRYYSKLALDQDLRTRAFRKTIIPVIKLMNRFREASEKKKNYVKLEVDGCLTSILKFWKTWVDRNGHDY
jgi:hypothetical protein